MPAPAQAPEFWIWLETGTARQRIMARAGKNASVGAPQTGVAAHGNLINYFTRPETLRASTQGQVDNVGINMTWRRMG